MARISVVIPARDAAATVGRTVTALAGQELDGDWEAILVDDGSRDDTVATARRVAEQAGLDLVIVHQEAEGPGPARNRGAREASAPAIAFLDADCFPQPGWLAAGLAALDTADLALGRVVPDPTEPLGPFDRSLWVTRESGLYEAASLFVRRDLFEQLGGFEVWLEPEVGKALAEDVWFGWRARRAGARIAFCEGSLAHHAVFRRGPAEFVAERRRLVHFPAIAAKVPELRREWLRARVFLTPRSAAFDAGVTALAGAALARSPLPLAAALPYAVVAAREARPWGRRAPAVLAAGVAADAVGAAALLRGSLKNRSVVL
jgi:glycosyltransferase involved in cell wall biosynthesis